jgi:hypothetical protein
MQMYLHCSCEAPQSANTAPDYSTREIKVFLSQHSTKHTFFFTVVYFSQTGASLQPRSARLHCHTFVRADRQTVLLYRASSLPTVCPGELHFIRRLAC